MPGVLGELMATVTEEIRRLNPTQMFDGINKLPAYWQKGVDLGGDYIEGF